MIDVAQTVVDRIPALGQGYGRALARPLGDLLRRVVRETDLRRALDAAGDARGFAFVARVLEHLDFDYRVAPTDRAHIPAEGRVVIVANHPLGGLDALGLLHLVGSVRRDVVVLANDVLLQLDPLRELLLPLDVFGSGGGHGLRAAYRALAREMAVIVFPAGEVSRIRPSGVRDRAWSSGFLRFARQSGSPVLPVHLAARNSALFYGASMLARPLATLMLPRELLRGRGGRMDVTVGAPVPAAALSGMDDRRLAARMRLHVYRLARRRPPAFATTSTIAHPEPVQAVRQAVMAGQLLGSTTDGKQIRLLDAAADNPALREIGRLREIAFRRVGEGTGLRRDLDRFDPHYRHIVLWDDAALEIAGAYRLGDIGRLLDRQGLDGLYSATLFDYTGAALPQLRQGVELGRSFVQPRYWGSRSLDYLWQGIGAFLRVHPEVRYLIGPVSLSAQLPDAVRAWIVAYHSTYFSDQDVIASAKNPYALPGRVAEQAGRAFAGLDAAGAARVLKARLAELDASLPTLYRQYVELCEPDGVRFWGFGVDPDFGGCVDGLIRIDLQRLRPAKRARYLGGPEAG